MSFVYATLKLIKLANKLYPLPSNADPRSRHLYKNVKTDRRVYRAVNFIGVVISAILWFWFGYRLSLIFIKWKIVKSFDTQDAVLYFVRLIIQSLNILLAHVLHHSDDSIRFAINQALYRASTKIENRWIQIKTKLLTYSSAACFLFLGLKAYVGPFGSSQRHLFGDNWPLKLLMSLSVGLSTTLLIFRLLYVQFLALIFCDASKPEMINLAESGSKKYTERRVNHMFKRFHRKYIIVQVVSTSYINCLEVFFCADIYLGILVASCAAFASITLFGAMHPLLYMGVPMLTLSCFVVAIILTHKFEFFVKNGDKFRRDWRGLLTTSETKKMLKSLQRIGIKLGPYGMVTGRLGIEICGDIIHNSITLLFI